MSEINERREAAGFFDTEGDEPMLLTGIPNNEYHADASRLGGSVLEVAKRSLQEFFELHIAKTMKPKPPGQPMIWGTRMHDALLEPDEFWNRNIRLPDTATDGKPWNWKSSKHRDERDAFLADNPGKVLITEEEEAEVQAVSDAVERNPEALQLINAEGRRECSIFWTDPATGIRLKCRPDILTDDNILVDLKTTRNPTPEAFAKAASDLGYYRKAALYSAGVAKITGEIPKYRWIAVGNTPPYDCYVYEPPVEELLGVAGQQVAAVLASIVSAVDSDEWINDDQRRVVPLPMPAWAARKHFVED